MSKIISLYQLEDYKKINSYAIEKLIIYLEEYTKNTHEDFDKKIKQIRKKI